jgi:hypothetical protein
MRTSDLLNSPFKKKNRIEKWLNIFILLALVVFGASIWILTSNLEYWADKVIESYPTVREASDSLMKTVEIVNAFDREVAVHYDDGETGLYLTSLDPNEKITIGAAIGQGLYITEKNGWERLDFIAVRPDIKVYTFSPHVQQQWMFRQLNVDKKKRIHPSVVPLRGGSMALSAKIRCAPPCFRCASLLVIFIGS